MDLRIIASTILLLLLPKLITLFSTRLNHYYNNASHFLFMAFSLVFTIISSVNLGYYLFFATPIDPLIFGLFEDDTKAVLLTMLQDMHLLILFFISILLLFANYYGFNFILRKSEKIPEIAFFKPLKIQISIIIASLVILAILARGSLGTFPLRKKTAAICSDPFLNSLVLNGIFNLYYANKYRNIEFNSSTENILKNAQVNDIETLANKSGYESFKDIYKTTPYNEAVALSPPHVVFVIMEGWSTHLSLVNTDTNNILGAFAKHKESGYWFNHFLSNRYGTNPSIEKLLTNSMITPLAQSKGNQVHFSSSNVLPFKKAGYQTKFISGGYSTWRNHDSFWPKQGFDEYIDRTAIEKDFTEKADNPWGTYDEHLFNYAKTVLLSAQQPSFSVLLTTNNHPPVMLPSTYVSAPLDAKVYGYNEKDDLQGKQNKMRGYQYQTNALGEFLDWLESSPLKDKVIVAATGDHILKAFHPYLKPSEMYQRYSVPFYLSIPKQYDTLLGVDLNIPGSHADVMPTIFELSLSQSKYLALGTAMQNKGDTPYGWIDQGAFIFDNGIYNPEDKMVYPITPPLGLLAKKGIPLSAKQQTVINQEAFRLDLSKWLLYRDYEKTKKKLLKDD